MRRAHRHAGTLGALVCAAVFAGGCAAWQWQKAGADPAALDEDLQQCQQQASARAYSFALSSAPEVIVTPSGTAGVVRAPHAVPPIDPVLANDLLSSCMRAKGYRLAPVR
ncbi:MAG: hypothetical protein A3G80_10995 [Betaproteobacteria bacterium RIFCSPLOWO2_12_FULL_62_13b]|nr:MAG: hypothetical protein A3G80_10995 [Betaproteobacteria bacterium RIFCSPLOWO2_12_FULL_62_13b]